MAYGMQTLVLLWQAIHKFRQVMGAIFRQVDHGPGTHLTAVGVLQELRLGVLRRGVLTLFGG